MPDSVPLLRKSTSGPLGILVALSVLVSFASSTVTVLFSDYFFKTAVLEKKEVRARNSQEVSVFI